MALKNTKACWHEKERDHLKKSREIDGNAEKKDGKKEEEKTFCLLGAGTYSSLPTTVGERIADC